MSSILRTLTDLRELFSDVLDVTVSSSGVRHTNATVDRRLNRAIRRWYTMVAEAGDNTYAASQSVATTPFPGNAKVIDITVPFMLIRGIELIAPDGLPASLQPGEFAERNELEGTLNTGTITGFPLYYKPGSGVSGTTAVYSVRIFPAADAVYTGIATIIPPPPVLSQGTDVIEIFASGDEWIANDAVMQSLISDQLADTGSFGALAARNAEIKKDMAFLIACRNPIRKVNTRDIERRNRIHRRWTA